MLLSASACLRIAPRVRPEEGREDRYGKAQPEKRGEPVRCRQQPSPWTRAAVEQENRENADVSRQEMPCGGPPQPAIQRTREPAVRRPASPQCGPCVEVDLVAAPATPTQPRRGVTGAYDFGKVLLTSEALVPVVPLIRISPLSFFCSAR